MKLLFDTFDEISKTIKSENKKIVVYGAGMIGMVYIPYLIEEYDLSENLICFFDSDVRKQEIEIQIGSKKFRIYNPIELKKIDSNVVIMITNSNYHPIIKILDSIKELRNNDVYIIPILQVMNSKVRCEKINVIKLNRQIIPKKIHYCWFSGNPLPDYLKKCMESWYKYCPDYEIIRWDESNYDVSKNLYMKQAYNAKKWGFVPDIARLDILYEHGGIYLDTDVELIRNIDDLLCQEAFVGVEKWGSVNMGGCSGAIPQHPIIKRMLDYRINERFYLEDGSLNLTTCGYYETKPLIELGMKPNNTVQQIEGMTVYSSDFFHPYDYMSGETTITDNTYSIHHFNGGWLNADSMDERKKTQELYQQMLKRMNVDNV